MFYEQGQPLNRLGDFYEKQEQSIDRLGDLYANLYEQQQDIDQKYNDRMARMET